ncbi:unnamed protein product, partial [Effrenium voratum]
GSTRPLSLHSTAALARRKRVEAFSSFFSGVSDVGISSVCWDEKGRCLTNFRGGDLELMDFGGSMDDSVPTLELEEGKVALSSVRSFRGRANEATCAKGAAFLCGGACVASGGDCGHLFLWSTESGQLLRKLRADRRVLNSLAPHPVLQAVAASGIDADIKFFDVAPPPSAPSPPPSAPSAAAASASAARRRARWEAEAAEQEGDALLRQGAWVEALAIYEALRLAPSRSCWLSAAACHS